MRIALVAPYDLARAGGINTHIRAQARALVARGHAVTLLGPASAPLGAGEVALGGVTTVTFGGTESGLGLNPAGARRAGPIDTTRYDVVHMHEPLVPLVPWMILRRATVPVVATFHVHRERGHRWYPAARPWLARLMRRVDYRIAVSDAAKRTVAAHFPGDYDIVPNGIDLPRYQQSRARPAAFLAERPHVVFAGRLEPRKGVAHLIRAMARVRQQHAAARLIVVGDGPDRQALEALARDLAVDALFTGRVDDDALVAWLQASDVVCSPATGGESFGLVLLEAMACAKPIVASAIEGYEALVGGTQCARLVTPGDDAALAAAIAGLLPSPQRRQQMGDAGAVAARRYDWPAIAQQLEQIYCRVLGGCQGAGQAIDVTRA